MKQSAGIAIIVFCFLSLILALLKIWNVIDNEIAKEAFTKISYTIGAVLAAFIIIFFVIKTLAEKK